jgi:hypothetical protein
MNPNNNKIQIKTNQLKDNLLKQSHKIKCKILKIKKLNKKTIFKLLCLRKRII